MQVTKSEIAGSIAAMQSATAELKKAHAGSIRAFATRCANLSEKTLNAESAANRRLQAALRAVTEIASF